MPFNFLSDSEGIEEVSPGEGKLQFSIQKYLPDTQIDRSSAQLPSLGDVKRGIIKGRQLDAPALTGVDFLVYFEVPGIAYCAGNPESPSVRKKQGSVIGLDDIGVDI